MTSRKKYNQMKKDLIEQELIPYFLHESSQYLFFECVKNKSRCHIVVNKKTRKVKEIKDLNSVNPYAIRDDIKGGYPFWPSKSNASGMLMFVESEALISYLSSSSTNPGRNEPLSQSLLRKIDRIKKEDNPVIIKIVLKK